MANTVTTTYAGEFSRTYIAAALLASKTIDNVTQHVNINNKWVTKKYANSTGFADAACASSFGENIALTEMILNPKQLKKQFKLCKLDYLADWEAMQMGFGNNRTLPPDMERFMLEQTAKEVTGEIERIMWQGTVGTAGEFDGFYAQFSAIDVAGTVITASNVIAELNKVVDAIPLNVKSQRATDLVIYVPTSVIFFYYQAQSALGAMDMFYERQASPVFYGIPLIECPGMLPNTMVAGLKSNFHFATGLLNDFNEVKVIDRSDIDASEEVYVSLKFSGDTGIGYEGDAVYYAYES